MEQWADRVRTISEKGRESVFIVTNNHFDGKAVVSVTLTDQNLRSTDAGGKVGTVLHKPGEASWGTAKTHKEENLNDKPLEMIMVEIKSSGA